MELKEDIVDIIVPFYPSIEGEKRLEEMKQSLLEIDPGFPVRLVIAKSENRCIVNRNIGLKQSNTRYYVTCDDDVVFIEKDWLKKALETIKSKDNIGAVGFQIVDRNLKTINTARIFVDSSDKDDKYTYNTDIRSLDKNTPYINEMVQCNLLPGCCVLYDRLVAGYWSQNTYHDKVNCDDSDYQCKIQENGFVLCYRGDIKIQHNEIPFAEKVKKYGIQKPSENHLIFQEKWKIKSIPYIENQTIPLTEVK